METHFFLHSGLNFFYRHREITGCFEGACSFSFAVGAMHLHENNGIGHGVHDCVYRSPFSLLRRGTWQMTILRGVISV
jgi:hypothetical protein